MEWDPSEALLRSRLNQLTRMNDKFLKQRFHRLGLLEGGVVITGGCGRPQSGLRIGQENGLTILWFPDSITESSSCCNNEYYLLMHCFVVRFQVPGNNVVASHRFPIVVRSFGDSQGWFARLQKSSEVMWVMVGVVHCTSVHLPIGISLLYNFNSNI